MIEFYYIVAPLDKKTNQTIGTLRFYETKTLAMMFAKELQRYGYNYMIDSYKVYYGTSKETCKNNNKHLKLDNLYFEFRIRGRVVKK